MTWVRMLLVCDSAWSSRTSMFVEPVYGSELDLERDAHLVGSISSERSAATLEAKGKAGHGILDFATGPALAAMVWVRADDGLGEHSVEAVPIKILIRVLLGVVHGRIVDVTADVIRAILNAQPTLICRASEGGIVMLSL